ncbi:monovalent cation/H+ antiporter subunit D family protein [Aquipuribacter sp. MA13-6]|uniref:monovalent cation/H+ antiporter subunit D family protein n=1 Tax=unclassified Aquipuribacter TaxID=2635084 RepID=UPI003EE8CB77
MSDLVPFLLWLPLLGAAGALAAGHRVRLQRAITFLVSTLVLGYGLTMAWSTSDGSVVVEQVAGWQGGIAIPFAVDTLSALMVSVAAVLVLASTAFAVFTGDDEDRYFLPLVLVLSGGVYGAFVTADLFNLFVMIEVALIPSYVLITRRGSASEMGAGRVYLTVNLLVSTVLLAGVGLVYGATGTVNLGELAGAATESVGAALGGGVVLIALAAKAALVPLHSWLPRTYPFASVATTALLSGLLTKIGVYGIFRIYAVMFSGDERLQTPWLVILLLTMVVGVLGALGESSMRTILAFHMTSQVGYILLAIGFFGERGLQAGIFYLVHHIIVKAALFLACGAVEHEAGTGTLSRLGGAARREPLLALAFMGAALSLVGIPPFSGFVAKYSLVSAAAVEGEWVAVALIVVVSLFTLLSMLKIWNGAFWGADPDEEGRALTPGASGALPDQTDPMSSTLLRRAKVAITEGPPGGMPRGLILPGLALAVLSLVIGLGADVLLGLAGTAAQGLVNPSAYVSAVAGR